MTDQGPLTMDADRGDREEFHHAEENRRRFQIRFFKLSSEPTCPPPGVTPFRHSVHRVERDIHPRSALKPRGESRIVAQ